MSWLDAPIETRPMTPADVQAVLADAVRQNCEGDPIPEHDDAIAVTRDTSVAELFDLLHIDCGCGQWKDVGEGLARWLGVDLSRDELECLLGKPKQTTVGELCDFVAPRAAIERVGPARIMGQTSWEAGIFRTVSAIIKRSGADVSDLSPSARLEPYLRSHPDVFCRDLARVFPALLPELREEHAPAVTWCGGFFFWGWWLSWGVVVLACAGFLGGFFSAPFLLAAGLMVLTYPAFWILGRFKPRSVRLGEFETFRDLCSALAAHFRSGTAALAVPRPPAPQAASDDVDLFEPATILGRPCREAGVFKGIREILRRDGAAVSDLAPSSAVEPYLRAHRRSVVLGIGRRAPGRLPAIREEFPVPTRRIRDVCWKTLCWSPLVYVPGTFVGLSLFGEKGLHLVGFAAIGLTLLLAALMFLCDLVKPRAVRLGECATFRDLCKLLAAAPGLRWSHCGVVSSATATQMRASPAQTKP